MIVVHLTGEDREQALRHGLKRQKESRRIGIKDQWNSTKHSHFQIDVLGVLGEIAVARYLEIEFSPTVNTFHHTADILHDIEVRTAAMCGNLIIRPQDRDIKDRKFVFVAIPRWEDEAPEAYLMGWLKGREAMMNKYWRDDKPAAWFVPTSDLTPISYLPTHVAYLRC